MAGVAKGPRSAPAQASAPVALGARLKSAAASAFRAGDHKAHAALHTIEMAAGGLKSAAIDALEKLPAEFAAEIRELIARL